MRILLFFFIISFLLFHQKTSENRRVPAQDITLDQSSLGWYKILDEEFDPASVAINKGADPKCFSKKAKCAKTFEWAAEDCAEEYQPQLKDLNKCTWKIYDFYNYMDFDAKEGDGINAFHPSKVKVENGKLILSADRSPIPNHELDCKRKYVDTATGFDTFTTKCGIYSGGIDSHGYKDWYTGEEFGFAQAYGRFEVVGKLSKGQGTWPAFWLLPKDGQRDDLPEGSKGKCGWPHSGEFDILESWSDNFDHVKSGYIAGYCNDNADVRKGFPREVSNATTEFHLYAMEWTPNYIRFIQDDEVVGYVYKDEKVKSQDRDTGKYGFKRKAWIPSYPFYWILNLSIEHGTGKGKEKVELDSFYHQELVVESVKTYRQCNPEDPKSSCVQFKMKDKGGVDGYNSNRRETAFAEINTYPNPIGKSDPEPTVTVRLKLYQNCQDVKIDVINMLGQQMAIVSDTVINGAYLYSDALEANVDLYRKMNIAHLSSGMYLVRAEYQKCGSSLNGEGNQVFKLLVL